METRDTKIQNGVLRINTRLKELEAEKNKLPKQKITSLAALSNSDLAKKYIEFDYLEEGFSKKKDELGLGDTELTIADKTPAEWKAAIKTQISLNKIGEERRKLLEVKNELEKYHTKDYVVDKLVDELLDSLK